MHYLKQCLSVRMILSVGIPFLFIATLFHHGKLAAQESTPEAADTQAAQAHVDQGLLQMDEEEYESAIDDFTRAIELDPDYALAYLARGFAYRQLDDTAASAEDYWQWITLNQERSIDLEDTPLETDFSLELQEGVVYRVPFEGEEGQVVDVTASAVGSTGVDSLIVILSADDHPLIADDNSGEGSDAAIQDYVLPASGNYTLVVSYAAGGSEGEISVLLALNAAQAEVDCTVRTDQERFATVRVGPGINRSAILFLPANQDFTVIGQGVADDDSRWWRLDKEEVGPDRAAAEFWVAQDQVTTTGNCEQVAQAEAPPIIPLVSAAEGGGGTPTPGRWNYRAGNGTMTCPDGTTTALAPPFQPGQDNLTVENGGAEFWLGPLRFVRVRPGVYTRQETGPNETLQVTVRVLSANRMVGTRFTTYNNGCTGNIPTTYTLVQ